MRMYREITAAMAVVMAFSINATTVAPKQASAAVRGWAARYHKPGRANGYRIQETKTHSTTNGTKFFSFKMVGGGTMIASSDTEITPVIAYTSGNIDFDALAENHPLKALINRDLSARQLAANEAAAQLQAAGTTASTSENASLWAELIAEGIEVGKGNLPQAAMGAGDDEWQPSDPRVPFLVKSKWSQSGNGENWYTPNLTNEANANIEGDAKNVVCGCVATALSQILRYHEYPNVEIETITSNCRFGGYNLTLTSLGGVYDWNMMPLTFDGEVTDENKRAIGKLTYDAGVSVSMMYDTVENGGSGAYAVDIPTALKNVWKYGSAYAFADYNKVFEGTSRRKALKRMLYANFDAQLPVSLGVSGVGGHQIVADGYGFEEGVDYVHLNMGWAGTGDAWYNLPDMTDVGFNAVGTVVYNIVTNGDNNTALVSGLVKDAEGNAVNDVDVMLYKNGELIAKTTTWTNGIWGVALTNVATAVTLSARAISADGMFVAELDGIDVEAPSLSNVSVNFDNGLTRTVEEVMSLDAVGNSYGNDFTLQPAAARIVVAGGADEGVTNIYEKLEAALADAKLMDEAGVPPVVELLSNAAVSNSVALNFNVAITSIEGEHYAINCANGSSFSVAAGYTTYLTNVVITAEGDTTPFEVSNGGLLVLEAGVELEKVHTEAADGLLFRTIPSNMRVDCDAALALSNVFAYAATNVSGVSTLRNARELLEDEYRGAAGEVEDEDVIMPLYWELIAPAAEDAVAYTIFTDESTGKAITNYYKTLDHALEEYAGGELVVRGTNTMSKLLEIANDMVLKGENGAMITGVVAHAGFTVRSGKLLVNDIVFADSTCTGLFNVEGENAELELGAGVVLRNLTGTASYLHNRNSGAINVMRGKAKLTGGAIITDCCTIAAYNDPKEGFGGGVYLDGTGCELTLDGCVITNCACQTYGGGVYVGSGAKINIQGETYVKGNYKIDPTNGNPPNNIYLVDYDSALGNFVLTDRLKGEVGVCWGESDTAGRELNDDFITIAAGVSAITSLRYFRCDCNTALYAAINGTTLAWTDVEPALTSVPTPIAFKSITFADDGASVMAELTNLVTGCWYSFYVTNQMPVTVFPATSDVPYTNFQAEADGPFVFVYPVTGSATNLYIRATGEDGTL